MDVQGEEKINFMLINTFLIFCAFAELVQGDLQPNKLL